MPQPARHEQKKRNGRTAAEQQKVKNVMIFDNETEWICEGSAWLVLLAWLTGLVGLAGWVAGWLTGWMDGWARCAALWNP